jgi:signal transduction histidine kinase
MQAVRENLSHLNPIRLAPVDVAACVADAIRSVDTVRALDGDRAADAEQGVVIETEQLDDLPAVVAGHGSLTLVFANLFENAAKAMEGAGRVTVRGRTRGDAVEISVSDSGPGIAPELHDRIFEFSFTQGARNRGHRARGKLGFGLWWVKTLMVRLGGSIAVESDGQHGTTFTLTLPRAQEGEGPRAQESPRTQEGGHTLLGGLARSDSP